jgi:hypothetical protein
MRAVVIVRKIRGVRGFLLDSQCERMHYEVMTKGKPTTEEPMHKHRAKDTRETCWSYCVAPHKSHDERTHGNIVRVKTCSCGARKMDEINGGQTVTSGWSADEEGSR